MSLLGSSAKAGGAAGSLAGPIGTAVGTAAGALLGGIISWVGAGAKPNPNDYLGWGYGDAMHWVRYDGPNQAAIDNEAANIVSFMSKPGFDIAKMFVGEGPGGAEAVTEQMIIDKLARGHQRTAATALPATSTDDFFGSILSGSIFSGNAVNAANAAPVVKQSGFSVKIIGIVFVIAAVVTMVVSWFKPKKKANKVYRVMIPLLLTTTFGCGQTTNNGVRQLPADWSAVSGVTVIKNKPILSGYLLRGDSVGVGYASRARIMKVADSLSALTSFKMNFSDSSAMLAGYGKLVQSTGTQQWHGLNNFNTSLSTPSLSITSGGFNGTVTGTLLTAPHNYNLPNADGTFVLASSLSSYLLLSGGIMSGSIDMGSNANGIKINSTTPSYIYGSASGVNITNAAGNRGILISPVDGGIVQAIGSTGALTMRGAISTDGDIAASGNVAVTGKVEAAKVSATYVMRGTDTLFREGTFTPVPNGIVFTSSSGYWVKVGRLVTVFYTIQFPATADVGAANVYGLPYLTQSSGGNKGYSVVQRVGTGTPGYTMVLENDYGWTNISAGGTQTTNAGLTGILLHGTFTYLTN